jgi:hypothetical protein
VLASPRIATRRSKIAGSRELGFADGRGDKARFRVISGLCVDTHGNVHAADRFDGAIRKIAADSKVATVAVLR